MRTVGIDAGGMRRSPPALELGAARRGSEFSRSQSGDRDGRTGRDDKLCDPKDELSAVRVSISIAPPPACNTEDGTESVKGGADVGSPSTILPGSARAVGKV